MIPFILTIFYLLFIVGPIGTFIHETGHAIAARIVKADQIQLSIGLGRKIKDFSIGYVQIKIHLLFFLGGFVQSERRQPYQLLEKISIAFFGPLHNIIYAVLFYYINLYVERELIQLLFLFNLWLAIMNMIPFKIKGRRSDGYTILKILTEH